jgi:hypothetical protein
MTTIVDLDTGQVLGIVDGRDSEGVRDWLSPGRSSGASECRSSRSTRQRRSARPCGCGSRAPRSRSTRSTWSNATGKLRAAWLVKEQLRTLLTTGSLADATTAKERMLALVERAAQPETSRLWRTVCRWWKEIEVLIVTGATTAKVEANNTAIKHIKRTGRGFTNPRNYKTRILLRSAARTAACTYITAEQSPRTVKSRLRCSLLSAACGLTTGTETRLATLCGRRRPHRPGVPMIRDSLGCRGFCRQCTTKGQYLVQEAIFDDDPNLIPGLLSCFELEARL